MASTFSKVVFLSSWTVFQSSLFSDQSLIISSVCLRWFLISSYCFSRNHLHLHSSQVSFSSSCYANSVVLLLLSIISMTLSSFWAIPSISSHEVVLFLDVILMQDESSQCQEADLQCLGISMAWLNCMYKTPELFHPTTTHYVAHGSHEWHQQMETAWSYNYRWEFSVTSWGGHHIHSFCVQWPIKCDEAYLLSMSFVFIYCIHKGRLNGGKFFCHIHTAYRW